MALPFGTQVVPFPITNEQFLRAVFGSRWGEALVAYFAGDPKPPNPRINWNTYPALNVLRVMGPELNNYWDVSLPKAGGSRQGADFAELYAIVIDDYGVKVDADRVDALMGRGPNYVIETSPGNYHAGWFIEPLADRAWVHGFLRALYRALGNVGDNLVKPTTLVRLPVGTNGKNNSKWKTKLIVWDPDPRTEHLDWIDIETRVGQVVPVDPRFDADIAMPDPAEIEADPVLQILRLRGMVLDAFGRTMTFGWGFEIECPWAGDHTDPRTNASYVPVKGRFKCHHGHCQDRNMGDLRAWADACVREDSGGLECLAALEFDEVPLEPGQQSALRAPGRDEHAGGAIDLWDQKTPPAWPGGVLPAILEDLYADLADRDGLDLGMLGATMMTAASGAADKRSRLTPYAGSDWQARPILWTMLIAETGQRKTPVLAYALKHLRQLNAARMKQYTRAMAAWKATPAAQRQGLAPDVAALLAEDATVERLQELMASNPRGMLYLKDELAGMLDFGRYSNGPGNAERAFFLETNEGGPYTVSRMSRTTTIDNTALAILGGMQPQRLPDLKGLTEDGLLSRFATIMGQQHDAGSVRTTPPDLVPITDAIDRMLRNGAFDEYSTDAAGEALIRETERLGKDLADQPGVDLGYRGFLRKLHGVHARAALVLHLMDGGQDQIVPADTVERAARYATFLFDHAEVFYAGLDGSAEHIARAIGSYLLRHPTDRITAGQLRHNVAACKPLRSLKEIQDAVFLLIMDGWLKPETNYPSNHAWMVRPGLVEQFTARKTTETARVERVKHAMNQLGRYR